MGNQLLLSADALKKNVRTVQERNDIEFENAETDLESWPMLGPNNEFARYCYHFSAESQRQEENEEPPRKRT